MKKKSNPNKKELPPNVRERDGKVFLSLPRPNYSRGGRVKKRRAASKMSHRGLIQFKRP